MYKSFFSPSKRWCSTVMLLMYLVININAQDIHFSQFIEAPLELNPANAGSFTGNHRIIINYKDQWRSIANPYSTFALSGDMNFMSKKSNNGHLAAGLFVYNDKAGDTGLRTTQANISLTYHLRIQKKQMLSAGLLGGISQRAINVSAMKWGNQYNGQEFDPGVSSGETINIDQYIYGDFGGGILWSFYTKDRNMVSNDGIKSLIGVSLLHINKPDQYFYEGSNNKLYSKLVFHGLVSIGVEQTNLAIIPQWLYYRQGPMQEIMLGSMFRYRLVEGSKYTGNIKELAYSIGGFYRVGDAFAAVIQFEYANYALGISYDINTSGLRSASSGMGGFEVFLRFFNPNPFSNKIASF